MEYQNLLVSVITPLATLTVNRPAKLNALNNETITELTAAIESLTADERVGAILLTGAGEKAFIAGADISVLARQGVAEGRENALHGQRLTQVMEASSKPLIAAINGYALGGGLEVALACDLRLASSNARLGLPEVSLGIIPGYGGTQRLARQIGAGRALEMILTGDPVTAEEAYRIGLVNAVCEPKQLLQKAQELARRIVSRGPTALALAKQAVRRGADMRLAEGLAMEADLFAILSATDEMKEGMQAFLDKREPDWRR